MYGAFEKAVDAAFGVYRSEVTAPRAAVAEHYSMASKGAELRAGGAGRPAVVDHTQDVLRGLYGKGPPALPAIGDHPDFAHLKDGEQTCNCAITTLFVDIEASTRLGLLYPLDKVRGLKNAIIKASIQIIKGFDGHVHRIMGDAVMAYFGGRFKNPEDGAVDGLNAAAVLQLYASTYLLEKLHDEGFKHPFGIRIGLDFGAEDDVLWGSYGYPGMNEVTATSFYVDVASKLQHAAGRNQVMLGQSLINFMDFPEDLLRQQTATEAGQVVPKPYLEPMLTQKDGSALHYKQRLLLVNDYLKASPMAFGSGFIQDKPFRQPLPMEATVLSADGLTRLSDYKATSRTVEKGLKVRFVPRPVFTPIIPYYVTFTIENHGTDALQQKGAGRGNESKGPVLIDTLEKHRRLEYTPDTKFRGLHYVTCEIDDRTNKFWGRFGVYVR